jgi:hypothetical protein
MARLVRAAGLILLAVTLASPARARAAEVARSAVGARGNAVTHWNRVATDAFTPSQGTNPMAQSRTLAIVHAAIHDAVNAIERRFESYTPGLADAPGASLDPAVAAAARDVLVTLLPDQAALVEAEYTRALAVVADGPSKAAGVATGKASATATLTRRQRDGAAEAAVAYVPCSGPGEYQFTGPFDFAAQLAGKVKPFVIDLRAHAVPAPEPGRRAVRPRPGASSPSGRRTARSAPRSIGDRRSGTRTHRSAGTGSRDAVVRQRNLDPGRRRGPSPGRFAMADGFIVGFEAKYRFRFWRPETATRDAAEDGNPRTKADPTWKPFLITPPCRTTLDPHRAGLGGRRGADRSARR